MLRRVRTVISMMIVLCACMGICACAGKEKKTADAGGSVQSATVIGKSSNDAAGTGDSKTDDKLTDAAAASGEDSSSEGAEDKKGEIYVLFTSDVHCGVDQGFGYTGLSQIRNNLESEGYQTLLVDDGDSIQGEPVGTLTKGEAMIDLMNDMKYDVAIPGNHEFDYGMERFLELTKMADFPYISCNFNKEGELVFDPYVIKEIGGRKIGFVGVTTPTSIKTSTPSYFQNDKGEYIYGFMQDKDGTALYEAVQKAVDDVRAEGADLVYVMGHLGNEDECRPWTYAEVIEHTTGIDIFLDGHSHDSDQVMVKDKDGEDVIRLAIGTKLESIGYTHINADGEVDDSGAWNWNNDISFAELTGIRNDMDDDVRETNDKLKEVLGEVVASTDVDLTITDPTEKDESDKPVRIVRRMETNLGDLVADAYRESGRSDIAFVNGGGIRTGIGKGDVTYGDIISVHPYGNELCVVEITGQQILDALEWGSRNVPGECGGFLQVSGLSYEIDTTVDNNCIEDENGMFKGIKGSRRVKNVKVGDEPIDPKAKYTVAMHSYMLKEHGDGYTMFDGEILQDSIKLDNQVLIEYMTETLGGKIGDGYSDPYGQGRITILE